MRKTCSLRSSKSPSYHITKCPNRENHAYNLLFFSNVFGQALLTSEFEPDTKPTTRQTPQLRPAPSPQSAPQPCPLSRTRQTLSGTVPGHRLVEKGYIHVEKNQISSRNWRGVRTPKIKKGYMKMQKTPNKHKNGPPQEGGPKYVS